MPAPREDIPVWMEEHPDRSSIAASSYDWPEQLVTELEALVAGQRAWGGDAA
jgi:hypothetical protein